MSWAGFAKILVKVAIWAVGHADEVIGLVKEVKDSK